MDHLIETIYEQGRRKLFDGGGGGGAGCVKISTTMGGRQKKKRWLKRPKVVPKSKTWTKI